MARIKASKVIKLIEKLKLCSSINTPIREIGIANIGIKMARNEPINIKITTKTIKVASPIVFITS